MAIVYKGRRRKFVESQHPRDPRTGEFVEKTGSHASWLMRIADRTQGPNVGGGFVKPGGTLRPAGGKASVGSLKGGEHAKVVGVDQYGKPISFNGYVQGKPGPVTVRQRGKRTPMLAVSMAETPSGGGANWRGTVYVKPDAQIERTRPKTNVARPEGGGSLDDRIAAIERQMADLGVNEGAAVRRMELQSQLTKLRKQRVAENPDLAAQLNARMEAQAAQRAAEAAKPSIAKIMRDAGIDNPPAEVGGGRALDNANARLRRGDDPREIARDLRESARDLKAEIANMGDDDTDSPRANGMRMTARILHSVADRLDALDSAALQARISADIARQRGEVDTSRVKQDDGGMAPTTEAAAPAGTMKIGKRDMTADQVIEYAKTKPAQFLADYAKGKYPNVRTGPNKLTRDNLIIASERIKDGSMSPDEAAHFLEGWGKLQTALGRTPYMFAATALRGNLRPKASAPEAPKSPFTVPESTAKKIAAKPVSFLGPKTPSTKSRITLAEMPKHVRPAFSAARKRDYIGAAIASNGMSRDDFQALPESLRTELLDALGFAAAAGDPDGISARDRLTGATISRVGSGGLSMSRDANALATVVGVKPPKAFTPLRDSDRTPRQQFAASLRELPAGNLRMMAAEVESGDLSLAEAADRLGGFRRSLAGRTMAPDMQRAVSDLEARLRTASQKELGLDKPAPTPPATAYASITKRATLLAMLRQRGLKAKRGAPEDDLRALLVEDDQKRGARGAGAFSTNPEIRAAAEASADRDRAEMARNESRESTDDARTIEQLAGMKRAALLAVRRNTPGTRTLRRGATEREIAEEIVRARKAQVAGEQADREGMRSAVLDDPLRLKVEQLSRMQQRTPSRDDTLASGLRTLAGGGFNEPFISGTPDVPAAPRPVGNRHLDAQIDATERLIAQTRRAIAAEEGRTRTDNMQSDREMGLRNQLRRTEAKLRELRAEKAKRVGASPVAAPDDITISPLRTEATVADIAAGIEVRRRRLASMRQRGASSTDIAEAEADMAAMQTRLSAAVRVETPPRPESQADIFRRHSQLTRAQFDALPQVERDRIIAELKAVRDSGEQQSYTIPSNRTSMGTTIRGLQDASWVRGAREKIRELTYVAPPPVDNSIAGRAARLKSGEIGSFGALDGVALHEFPALARAAGFAAPGASWKRAKAVAYLEDQVRMGDRRPKSTNPTQMAEAMRGADQRQALAILDYVEAGTGLTKADMTAIARELGVRAPKGDKRAMMHGLAAAAKEAPGKAEAAPAAAPEQPKTMKARKGDLVAVQRTTRDYVTGQGSTERAEVQLAMVESVDRNGVVKSYRTVGWGDELVSDTAQKVDPVREKTLAVSQDRVDVRAALEAAKRHTWPNSTQPKAFDSFEEAARVAKQFALKEGDVPRGPVVDESTPKGLRAGDRIRISEGREAVVIAPAQQVTAGFGKPRKEFAVKLRTDDGTEGHMRFKPTDKIRVVSRAPKA